jgi:hypothetical protein
MVERVNKLHSELYTHTTIFENLTKIFQRQIDGLAERLKKIEKFIYNSQKNK